MVKVCGSGLAPPKTFVKFMGFTWLKRLFVPTTTLTGIVTLPLAAWIIIWPMNVPASKPPPGKLPGTNPTVRNDGALPLVEEMVSQPPPSEVLLVAVQLNVPDPPLRICMVWLVGVVLAVSREKLTWPGRLSTMVAPAVTTVKVTGIVSVTLPDCEVTTTWPV